MNPYNLYMISAVPVIIPLILFTVYLYKHLNCEEGSVDILRNVLFAVSIANIINWVSHIVVSYFAATGTPIETIIIYITIANFLLSVVNIWALIKVKCL